MSGVKKYIPANVFTEEEIDVIASLVADHAIRAAGVGNIEGVFRETAKFARLAQDILIELGLLVPEGGDSE